MQGLDQINVGPPALVEIGETRVEYYSNTNVTPADNYTTTIATTTPDDHNHYQTTELEIDDNREEENLVLFENYEKEGCLFTCLFGTLCSFQVQADPDWKNGQEQEQLI